MIHETFIPSQTMCLAIACKLFKNPTSFSTVVCAKFLSIFTVLSFHFFFLNKMKQNKLLSYRYLTHTLDMFVEQDYSLVYFHYGLTSKNKPPLSWLWQAYKAFDRKYKKNLKALYLVHPTNFIRIVWQIFKPAIRYM